MKKIITASNVAVSLFLPAVAFAQQKDLSYIVTLIVKYFNTAVYLTIGLAIVMFTWNIFKYFIKGGDDITAKKEAGQYVLWSVVGFFVILSFWGIVNILTNTFRLDSTAPSSFFGSFGSSGGTGGSPFGGGTSLQGGSTGGTQIQGGSTGGTQIQGGSTGGEKKGFLRTLWGVIY